MHVTQAGEQSGTDRICDEKSGLGVEWVRDEPPMGKIYSHSGGHPGFATNYFRYPDKKMTLVVCRNVENRNFDPYLRAIQDLLPFL